MYTLNSRNIEQISCAFETVTKKMPVKIFFVAKSVTSISIVYKKKDAVNYATSINFNVKIISVRTKKTTGIKAEFYIYLNIVCRINTHK